MNLKLEALFDAVIVKPIEEEETQYGSIIVPDVGKEKNEKGTVIAVGPGKPNATGGFIHNTLKVDDVVILPTMGFTKLEHEGEEYYIGPENQILARINQEKEEDLPF
jgi:chaperonin GroES